MNISEIEQNPETLLEEYDDISLEPEAFLSLVENSKAELLSMLQTPIVGIMLVLKPEEAASYLEELIKDHKLYHHQIKWLVFSIIHVGSEKTVSLDGGTGSGKSWLQLFEAKHLNVIYRNNPVLSIYTSPTTITDALVSNSTNIVREARKHIRKHGEPKFAKNQMDYKFNKLLDDTEYGVAIHHKIVEKFDNETKEMLDFLVQQGKFFEIGKLNTETKTTEFSKFAKDHSKLVVFASIHYLRPKVDKKGHVEETNLTRILVIVAEINEIKIKKISFDEVHAYYHSSDKANMPEQTTMSEKQFNASIHLLFVRLFNSGFMRAGYSGTLSLEQEENMKLLSTTGIINFIKCDTSDIQKTIIGFNNASVEKVVDLATIIFNNELVTKGYIELNFKYSEKLVSARVTDVKKALEIVSKPLYKVGDVVGVPALNKVLFELDANVSFAVDYMFKGDTIKLKENKKVESRELKESTIYALKYVQENYIDTKKLKTMIKVSNDGVFDSMSLKELTSFYETNYSDRLDEILISSSKEFRLLSSNDPEQFKNGQLEYIFDKYPSIKVICVNNKHSTGFSSNQITNMLYLSRLHSQVGLHSGPEQAVARITRDGGEDGVIVFGAYGQYEKELVVTIFGERKTMLTPKTKEHLSKIITPYTLQSANSILTDKIAETIKTKFNETYLIDGGLKTFIDSYNETNSKFIASCGLNDEKATEYVKKMLPGLSSVLSIAFENQIGFATDEVLAAGGLEDSDAIFECDGHHIKVDMKVNSEFVEDLDTYTISKSSIGLKGADRTSGKLKLSNLYLVLHVVMDAKQNYIIEPRLVEFKNENQLSIKFNKLDSSDNLTVYDL